MPKLKKCACCKHRRPVEDFQGKPSTRNLSGELATCAKCRSDVSRRRHNKINSKKDDPTNTPFGQQVDAFLRNLPTQKEI